MKVCHCALPKVAPLEVVWLLIAVANSETADTGEGEDAK
jgi:hypothetical protein